MFTHVLASGRVWRAVRKQQQEVTLRAARSEWCWSERSETEMAQGEAWMQRELGRHTEVREAEN